MHGIHHSGQVRDQTIFHRTIEEFEVAELSAVEMLGVVPEDAAYSEADINGT